MTALPTFVVVTYIVTWSLWFAAGVTPAAGPRGLLFLLGTFAPGFVALWLTGRATGRSGVTALLRRLIDWQVPARWYVFAVSYIGVVKLTVALVHRAATGAWPRFGVAMAWLYANTRGSLLPVMLMHAAVNNTKDIVPSAEPTATNPWALSHSLVAWLTVAVLSLCAGYFLLRMRKIPHLAREVAQSVAT